MMKRLFALILALALLLCGCAEEPEQTQPTVFEPNNTVGICLPDFTWSEHGQGLKAALEAEGCQVFLEYASSDVQQQHAQVQTFVNMPVGCIVVAAIDSMALTDVLSDARQSSVPVIALDRMLMYTDGVTGCVALDSYAIGQQLGRYIVAEKQLETAKEPVTVEFLMGTAENNHSYLLYQGLMEQLQPYLASGILQCRSGRTAFEDACIQTENADDASDRCFDCLAEFYPTNAPDVICAASDVMAEGGISALSSFGLEPGDQWPLVIGAGTTEDGLQSILDGYRRISLYTDTDAIVAQCAQWVHAVIYGNSLTGDTTFNGVTDVPTVCLPPVLIDAENCKDYLPQE